MNAKAIILVNFLWVLAVNLSFSQKMLHNQGNDSWKWLETKKKEFKESSNDSLFIVNNSDRPYRYIYMRRGDQEEDIEEVIFSAKPSEVVGPFPAESYNYLLKVISFDSIRTRIRAKHIFILPEGRQKKDSVAAVKKAIKCMEILKNGESFFNVFDDYSENFAPYSRFYNIKGNFGSGNLGWIMEDATMSDFNDPLMKANEGDVLVIPTKYGVHVVVVSEKQRGPSKVKLLSVAKKTAD